MASNWWDSPESDETQNPLITPYSVGLGVPRLNGQRLGSFRLQVLARDLVARQELEQRLFPSSQTIPTADVNPLMQNLPQIPTPLVQQPQPQEAPSWWAPAGTAVGDFERNFTRGNVLQKGLSTLELAGRGLGSFAQGVEGVVGSFTNLLPQVGGGLGTGFGQAMQGVQLNDVLQNLGNPAKAAMDVLDRTVYSPEGQELIKESLQKEGLVTLKPNSAQAAIQQAQDIQKYLGQDYTQKYRSQSDWNSKTYFNAQDPAAWADFQTRNIAYSGLATGDARQRASQRVLAGEDPAIVLRGMEKPGDDAYADELTRWQEKTQEYIDGQGRLARVASLKAGGSADQASQAESQARQLAAGRVNANNLIPGEEQPVMEMVGQMALDPLNLPQVNKAQKIILGPVINKLKGTTKAVDRTAIIYDDAMKAEVSAVSTGIGPRVQAVGTKLEESTGKGNQVAKLLSDAYRKGVKVFAYTPQTQAKVLTGTVYKQLGNLATGAENGAQMTDYLTKFMDNPAALINNFGVVPQSIDAEVTRPVLQAAKAKLMQLPSLKAGRRALNLTQQRFSKRRILLFTTLPRQLPRCPINCRRGSVGHSRLSPSCQSST